MNQIDLDYQNLVMNQIDIDYQNLVRDILKNGFQKNDRTGTGTISVFGRTIRHSMKDGFPLLTTKKMAFKTMVTELLWFLSGRTDLKWLLERNNTIWVGDAYRSYLSKWKPIGEGPIYINALTQEEFINKIKTDDEFAKKWGKLGPVYGKQWRRWTKYEDESIEHNEWYISSESIDQIANVINLLKTDPDSRRMIVNAWNVGELDQMVLPPCHMMFQFYTRELTWDERHELAETKYQLDDTDEELDKHGIPTRAISLKWTQRSVDVGLGLPFNIASYALLLEIVAKAVNMVPEEVIGDLGDCHIYNNHMDGLKEQLTRTPYELPTVKIREDIIEHGNEDIDPIPWYSPSDFILENYQSHPAIKLPLSN